MKQTEQENVHSSRKQSQNDLRDAWPVQKQDEKRPQRTCHRETRLLLHPSRSRPPFTYSNLQPEANKRLHILTISGLKDCSTGDFDERKAPMVPHNDNICSPCRRPAEQMIRKRR